jgi:hypothetical protein
VVVVVPLLVVVVVVVPPVVVVTGHETDLALMTTPAPKLQFELALGEGVGEGDETGGAGATITGTGDVTRILVVAPGVVATGCWIVTTFGCATGAAVRVTVWNSGANGLPVIV